MDGASVVATIPFDLNGRARKMDRVVNGARIRVLAGHLKISAGEARRLVADVLGVWVATNFCGSHEGWFERVTDEVHKRHREQSYVPPVSRREAERSAMAHALAVAKNHKIIPLTIQEQEDEERMIRGRPPKHRPARAGEPGWPGVPVKTF